MPRLTPITAKKLIKILEQQGFCAARQKGSHIQFIHADGRQTTVPQHSSEDLGRGLLRKIIRDINLSVEEFNALR